MAGNSRDKGGTPTHDQQPMAPRRGRRPIPPNETRRQRSVRIATRRVNHARKDILQIRKRSSVNHELGFQDVQKMKDSLQQTLDYAFAAFKVENELPEFTLED